MDARLSFKVAFLQKCAAAGLDMAQTLQAVREARATVKTAGMMDTADDVMGAAGRMAGGLGTIGLLGALAAPPVLGFAGGYGLSRLTDIDDEDVDAIRTQELIAEYRRNAQRLKNRQRLFRLPAPA